MFAESFAELFDRNTNSLNSQSLLNYFHNCLFSACENLKNSHAHEKFAEAFEYPLRAGGKRIRPLIALATACAAGGLEGLKRAKNASVALEFIHTYSLVHDDLPALDNDDLRRGKPTTHKVFGEDFAILVGDALLTEAFVLLSSSQENSALHLKEYLNAEVRIAMIQQLSKDAGAQGMIWGQWLDVENSKQNYQNWDLLKNIHVQKTGKLFASSFVLGSLSGLNVVNPEIVAICAKLGCLLGLAFQVQDDILDSTQNSEVLGKTAGKDLHLNKLTAVSVFGVEEAQKIAKTLTDESLSELKKLCEIFRNTNKVALENRSEARQEQIKAEAFLMETCSSLLKRSS